MASGAAWSRIDVDGPGPREDHTWTVGEDGRAYLFGGRADGKALADLWAYDVAADRWARIRPEGRAPDARFGHTAIWAPGVGLVVWSGQAGSGFFDDVWAFDPATVTWDRLPSTGAVPEARYGSCAVLGADGRMWVSHGFTDRGRFFDTRAYDLDTGRWQEHKPSGPVPVERCLHDCLWTPDGDLLLYAGQTTGVPALADLWTLDVEARAWTEVDARVRPAARQLYALATIGDQAWVHGGAGKDGDKLDDLWRLDLSSRTWQQLDAPGGPSARSGATLIADPIRGRLLLFGGVGQRGGERADTWQLDVTPPS